MFLLRKNIDHSYGILRMYRSLYVGGDLATFLKHAKKKG